MQTFPARSSIILPTVILEGKPCGFMIVSGTQVTWPCSIGNTALTWNNALIVKRHILLIYNKTANAFLTVSGREFVTQLGSSCLPYQNLDKSLIVISVGDHDLVDMAGDG